MATAAQASDPHQMGADESAQQARQHILCVNGAAEFLGLLAELFSLERYNVTTTNYVPQTFDQIAALQPDLIVVDLVIGVQAGWTLLEQLTRDATTRGIPVIVTSTDRTLLDDVHADPARYGTHRQLVKPFDIDTIVGIVAELIGPA